MFDRLRYEPRRLAVAGGGLVAVLVIGLIAAVALHVSGHSRATTAKGRIAGASAALPTGTSAGTAWSPTDATPYPNAPPATDVARWNAMPAVTPATSSDYPAIPAVARGDATNYARAFATELFSRDYGHAVRSQLIAWAQSEDAPLRSPNYPVADWTKVLVDSLTDLTWDTASDTPIPADGPWLALRTEQARDTVSDVRVGLDPQWEQQIAAGNQPPDPLATARDVSLTVTRHTDVAGQVAVTEFAVSLAVQLGTAPRGGYGVAVTNNYVVRQVS